MRTLRGNTNGPATNGLPEPNHCIRDEQKEVRNGIVTNGHGLSEEDESRINEDTEDPKFGPKELVWPQAVHQRPQQQHQGPQGPVVCWERFLPVRSIKFLLVENDDSTRHVVSALLRNCSYEGQKLTSCNYWISILSLMYLIVHLWEWELPTMLYL